MNTITEAAEPMALTPLAEAQAQAVQALAPPRQLSVVEYAIAQGAPAAEVRALVELQIRMDEHKLAMLRHQDEREREQRKEAAALAFDDALAAFRGENIIIPKTKHVDRGRGGSFSQAEFDEVCRRLSPALSKHGFSFRHDQKFGTKEFPQPDNPHNVAPWVWVTCFLKHKGGHGEELPLEGPADDQSVNSPVQNMQSTASFLKRQSLLAITGTATGGEDDESQMRRSAAESRGDPTALEELIDAGRERAMGGMAELTEWWRLRSPREQKDLQGEYGAMRRAAQAADKEKQP